MLGYWFHLGMPLTLMLPFGMVSEAVALNYVDAEGDE